MTPYTQTGKARQLMFVLTQLQLAVRSFTSTGVYPWARHLTPIVPCGTSSPSNAENIIHAFISSHLDYSNTLFTQCLRWSSASDWAKRRPNILLTSSQFLPLCTGYQFLLEAILQWYHHIRNKILHCVGWGKKTQRLIWELLWCNIRKCFCYNINSNYEWLKAKDNSS